MTAWAQEHRNKERGNACCFMYDNTASKILHSDFAKDATV